MPKMRRVKCATTPFYPGWMPFAWAASLRIVGSITTMTEEKAAQTILRLDRSIDAYIRRCRERVPSFTAAHFGFRETWKLQKPSFWWDLMLSPVNSAWAIPYLTLKKTTEILDKVGVPWIHAQVLKIPSGIQTRYQKKVETLIQRDLLEWGPNAKALPEGFTTELASIPELQAKGGLSQLSVRAVVDQFSSARALVSDLSGTLFTLLLGRMVFGDSSLSLGAMAFKFAKWKAHDEAASDFFLGAGVGGAFYDIFPPDVNPWDVRLFLVILTVTLALGSMLCALLSDPLRKYAHLQERRLNVLLDEMEKELIVFSHRQLKSPL